MPEGKVTTDEIYNTIIENHNMTQLKINEILGIVQQLVKDKDNVKKPSTYKKSTSSTPVDKGDKSDWSKKRKTYMERLNKGEIKVPKEETLKYYDIEFNKEEEKYEFKTPAKSEEIVKNEM